MNYRTWLISVSLFLSLACHASAPPSNKTLDLRKSVDNALTLFEQTKMEHWSFRVSRYENEEGDITSSIEEYSPLLAPSKRWSLIQVNNKPATHNEQRKFQKQKESKKEGTSLSIALRELINQESLTWVSENQLEIKGEFNVFIKKLGKSASKKLKGHLIYNKQQHFIERITIENKAEFSPIFSANISEFKLSFSFTNIDDNILPIRQDMQMKGSFAIFTEIDEVSHDSYSNYQYLPPTTEP